MTQLLGRRTSLQILTGLALAWRSGSTLLQASETRLPVPDALPQAALAATRQGEPLVLLISLPGCPYCELVRRNYLLPARRTAGLQAWQLDVADQARPLTGFDGVIRTADQQTRLWKARFTPTVLFFDATGREVAERLVGVASPDFYGSYLDERLTRARQTLTARPAT